MKIAIVVPCIHDGGGVPKVAQYLCEILVGHEFQLISVSTASHDKFSVRLFKPNTWFKGIKKNISRWEGHEVIDVGAFMTEFEFQRYMPREVLTSILNQFDVIQIVAGAPAWAYLARHCKPPVCLQIATLVKEERRRLIADSKGPKKIYLMLSTLVTGFIEDRALRLVDLVFVENHWLHEYVKIRIGESRVVMAPPGIDTDKFFPRRSDSVSTPISNYLVSVGRFSDRRKNVQLLFHAYHRLRQINPGCPRMLLIGLSEPNDDDWDLAKKLGIDSQITYLKNVSSEDLISYLQDAEIFVSSSDEEGLGIAMMEALACGVPVVSTRCGGPETFMNDGVNGYLVPRNDPEQLADRLNCILSDNNLRSIMSNNARKIMEEKFSLEATGRTFISHYIDVLKSVQTPT